MATVTGTLQAGSLTKSVKSTTSDVDVGHVEIHDVDERKVLWKIDRVILPLMCAVFFFQYLDKQSIGFAAVFNLQKDLGMDSSEYSWAISLFYFGQLVAEFIFIYLMSRLPITKFVGVSIVIWGLVAASLAAPKNFAGFGAVRFLLGFCEGAVSPSFVIITSTWYKRSEHPIRIAAWVSCNGLAQIIGGIMMYGIGLADNVALANWRIMFLVCGGGTVLAGMIFIALMPIGPETAWFLTEPERRIAVQRLAADRLSKEQTTFSKSQMMEAFTDPRTYMFCMFAFLGTLAGPVLKFASLVISGFGFSKFNTMLVGLPGGFLQILFIWIVVIGIKVTTIPRSYWGMGVCLIPLIGNIGIMTLPAANKWGIVVCTWLATIISPVLVITLSLMASNIKGNTKKSTVSNMYFVSYAIAAIAAPQLWLTKDSPRFTKGLIADMFSFAALITLFMVFRLYCACENRKRDQAESVSDSQIAAGDSDITDRQDLAFRYTA